MYSSATNTVPVESTANPVGTLNPTLVAIPSADPDELPTIVVTTPADVILRIRLLT